MYQRYSITRIENSLSDTPVVMVTGPRQCGKTTLVKHIIREGGDREEWTYITFDDLTQLSLAQYDPVGFIRNLPQTRIALDEIQRVPELLLSIKQSIDETREPGRFLLTGSANAMLLPKVLDSLAGRIESITLFPLSECELRGHQGKFLDQLLAGQPPITHETRVRPLLIEKIIRGGFPEPLSRPSEHRQTAWYHQYIQSLIQKDLKELAQIENLELIPRLLRLLASHVGQLMNYTELANKIGLVRQTMMNHLALLEQLFLLYRLPAWHRNTVKRLIKSPKLHLIDTGLLCALRGINATKIHNDPNLFGHLLESYVVGELKKQASWRDEPLSFFHYRSKDKTEVDLVIETPSGGIIGIEVKASATLNTRDFRGLQQLKEVAGDDFLIGVLLYDGDHTTPFSDHIYAAPIGTLWAG